MARWGFWLIFVVPAIATWGLAQGGAWTAAALLFVFVCVPLAEPLLGVSTSNREPQSATSMLDAPLFAWVVVQLALLGYGICLVVHGQRSPGELLLAAAVVGTATGAGGITIAHELMHRPSRSHRLAAEMLMASVTYTHFCIEHVHGHHRHVATPQDPASAAAGQSVYRFMVRSVVGGLLSAARLERSRARRQQIPWWSPRHRLTRYLGCQAAVYLAVWMVAGWPGVGFWLVQSLVAISLLEIINYIEHYGLRRREVEPGRYERVGPQHSWNANHRLTNWLLFNLQRHSDHHFAASRPYWQLRHHDSAPQLPAGYATMILVALVPPLWRRLMDPIAAAWTREQPAAP